MSTMGDKKYPLVVHDNIRGLIQDLSEQFDAMSDVARKQTVFADARPADAKTFMLISRHPRGLTELAKALKISRQAAHKSVQRLVEAGLIEFEFAEGSKRDKIARITKPGLEARKVGLGIAAQVEAYVKERVGEEGLEQLRRLLIALKP